MPFHDDNKDYDGFDFSALTSGDQSKVRDRMAKAFKAVGVDMPQGSALGHAIASRTYMTTGSIDVGRSLHENPDILYNIGLKASDVSEIHRAFWDAPAKTLSDMVASNQIPAIQFGQLAQSVDPNAPNANQQHQNQVDAVYRIQRSPEIYERTAQNENNRLVAQNNYVAQVFTPFMQKYNAENPNRSMSMTPTTVGGVPVQRVSLHDTQENKPLWQVDMTVDPASNFDQDANNPNVGRLLINDQRADVFLQPGQAVQNASSMASQSQVVNRLFGSDTSPQTLLSRTNVHDPEGGQYQNPRSTLQSPALQERNATTQAVGSNVMIDTRHTKGLIDLRDYQGSEPLLKSLQEQGFTHLGSPADVLGSGLTLRGGAHALDNNSFFAMAGNYGTPGETLYAGAPGQKFVDKRAQGGGNLERVNFGPSIGEMSPSYRVSPIGDMATGQHDYGVVARTAVGFGQMLMGSGSSFVNSETAFGQQNVWESRNHRFKLGTDENGNAIISPETQAAIDHLNAGNNINLRHGEGFDVNGVKTDLVGSWDQAQITGAQVDYRDGEHALVVSMNRGGASHVWKDGGSKSLPVNANLGEMLGQDMSKFDRVIEMPNNPNQFIASVFGSMSQSEYEGTLARFTQSNPEMAAAHLSNPENASQIKSVDVIGSNGESTQVQTYVPDRHGSEASPYISDVFFKTVVPETYRVSQVTQHMTNENLKLLDPKTIRSVEDSGHNTSKVTYDFHHLDLNTLINPQVLLSQDSATYGFENQASMLNISAERGDVVAQKALRNLGSGSNFRTQMLYAAALSDNSKSGRALTVAPKDGTISDLGAVSNEDRQKYKDAVAGSDNPTSKTQLDALAAQFGDNMIRANTKNGSVFLPSPKTMASQSVQGTNGMESSSVVNKYLAAVGGFMQSGDINTDLVGEYADAQSHEVLQPGFKKGLLSPRSRAGFGGELVVDPMLQAGTAVMTRNRIEQTLLAQAREQVGDHVTLDQVRASIAGKDMSVLAHRSPNSNPGVQQIGALRVVDEVEGKRLGMTANLGDNAMATSFHWIAQQGGDNDADLKQGIFAVAFNQDEHGNLSSEFSTPMSDEEVRNAGENHPAGELAKVREGIAATKLGGTITPETIENAMNTRPSIDLAGGELAAASHHRAQAQLDMGRSYNDMLRSMAGSTQAEKDMRVSMGEFAARSYQHALDHELNLKSGTSFSKGTEDFLGVGKTNLVTGGKFKGFAEGGDRDKWLSSAGPNAKADSRNKAGSNLVNLGMRAVASLLNSEEAQATGLDRLLIPVGASDETAAKIRSEISRHDGTNSRSIAMRIQDIIGSDAGVRADVDSRFPSVAGLTMDQNRTYATLSRNAVLSQIQASAQHTATAGNHTPFKADGSIDLDANTLLNEIAKEGQTTSSALNILGKGRKEESVGALLQDLVSMTQVPGNQNTPGNDYLKEHLGEIVKTDSASGEFAIQQALLTERKAKERGNSRPSPFNPPSKSDRAAIKSIAAASRQPISSARMSGAAGSTPPSDSSGSVLPVESPTSAGSTLRDMQGISMNPSAIGNTISGISGALVGAGVFNSSGAIGAGGAGESAIDTGNEVHKAMSGREAWTPNISNELGSLVAENIALYDKGSVGGVPFGGSADAETVKNGAHSIVDFKTASRPLTAEQLEDYKDQAEIYAHLANTDLGLGRSEPITSVRIAEIRTGDYRDARGGGIPSAIETALVPETPGHVREVVPGVISDHLQANIDAHAKPAYQLLTAVQGFKKIVPRNKDRSVGAVGSAERVDAASHVHSKLTAMATSGSDEDIAATGFTRAELAQGLNNENLRNRFTGDITPDELGSVLGTGGGSAGGSPPSKPPSSESPSSMPPGPPNDAHLRQMLAATNQQTVMLGRIQQTLSPSSKITSRQIASFKASEATIGDMGSVADELEGLLSKGSNLTGEESKRVDVLTKHVDNMTAIYNKARNNSQSDSGDHNSNVLAAHFEGQSENLNRANSHLHATDAMGRPDPSRPDVATNNTISKLRAAPEPDRRNEVSDFEAHAKVLTSSFTDLHHIIAKLADGSSKLTTEEVKRLGVMDKAVEAAKSAQAKAASDPDSAYAKQIDAIGAANGTNDKLAFAQDALYGADGSGGLLARARDDVRTGNVQEGSYLPDTPTARERFSVMLGRGSKGDADRAEANRLGWFGAPGSMERAGAEALGGAARFANSVVNMHYQYKNIARSFIDPVSQSADQYNAFQATSMRGIATSGAVGMGGFVVSDVFQNSSRMSAMQSRLQTNEGRAASMAWTPLLSALTEVGAGDSLSQIKAVGQPALGMGMAAGIGAQAIGLAEFAPQLALAAVATTAFIGAAGYVSSYTGNKIEQGRALKGIIDNGAWSGTIGNIGDAFGEIAADAVGTLQGTNVKRKRDLYSLLGRNSLLMSGRNLGEPMTADDIAMYQQTLSDSMQKSMSGMSETQAQGATALGFNLFKGDASYLGNGSKGSGPQGAFMAAQYVAATGDTQGKGLVGLQAALGALKGDMGYNGNFTTAMKNAGMGALGLQLNDAQGADVINSMGSQIQQTAGTLFSTGRTAQITQDQIITRSKQDGSLWATHELTREANRTQLTSRYASFSESAYNQYDAALAGRINTMKTPQEIDAADALAARGDANGFTDQTYRNMGMSPSAAGSMAWDATNANLIGGDVQINQRTQAGLFNRGIVNAKLMGSMALKIGAGQDVFALADTYNAAQNIDSLSVAGRAAVAQADKDLTMKPDVASDPVKAAAWLADRNQTNAAEGFRAQYNQIARGNDVATSAQGDQSMINTYKALSPEARQPFLQSFAQLSSYNVPYGINALDTSAYNQINQNLLGGNIQAANQQTTQFNTGLSYLAQRAGYGAMTQGNLDKISQLSGTTASQFQFATAVLTGDPMANSFYADKNPGNGNRRLLQTSSRGGTFGMQRDYDESVSAEDATRLGKEGVARGYIRGDGRFSVGQLSSMNAVQREDAAHGLEIGQRNYDFALQNRQQARSEYTTHVERGFEDRGIQLNRAQQDFSFQQQGISIGYQQQGINLGNAQFNEQWQFGVKKFNYETQYNRNEMNIGHAQGVVQHGWQMQDLAYQKNMSQISFGNSMIDADENIRYSTGRARRDAMRHKEEAVVGHSMEMGHMDVEKKHAEQQFKWGEDRFNREKVHFEQQTQFQKTEMDMSKRFHDQNAALQQQQFNLQVQDYQRQRQFTLEQRVLDDQQRTFRRGIQDIELAENRASLAYHQEIKRTIDDIQGASKIYGDEISRDSTSLAALAATFGLIDTSSGLFNSTLGDMGTYFTKLQAQITNLINSAGNGSTGNVTPANIIIPNVPTSGSHGNTVNHAGSVASSAAAAQTLKDIHSELKAIHADGSNSVINIHPGNVAARVSAAASIFDKVWSNR